MISINRGWMFRFLLFVYFFFLIQCPTSENEKEASSWQKECEKASTAYTEALQKKEKPEVLKKLKDEVNTKCPKQDPIQFLPGGE